MDGEQHTNRTGKDGDPECQLCPVCTLLRCLSETHPEVRRHLLAAARELGLALSALLESQAQACQHASDPAGDDLRRIRLD